MGRGTKRKSTSKPGGDAAGVIAAVDSSPVKPDISNVQEKISPRSLRSLRRSQGLSQGSAGGTPVKRGKKAKNAGASDGKPVPEVAAVKLVSQAEEEPEPSVSGGSDSDFDLYASDADAYCGESARQEEEVEGEQQTEAVCMDEEGRLAQQKEAIESVSGLLGVSSSSATLLLRHFRWNQEDLLEKYMEDATKACKEAGVPILGEEVDGTKASQWAEDFDCGICRDRGRMVVSALSCGHAYCDTCWGQYLTMKVTDGEMRVRCPADKCHIKVTDDLIQSVCSQSTLKKYSDFAQQAFVDGNSGSIWCPYPDCGLSVATSAGSKFVTCQRGHMFCTECLVETHAPASCAIVKVWKKKCEDDSETCNWLNANTQDCPKCQCIIEKNGGCNHMTCKKCKHEFCWVCMGTWAQHTDFYSCNRYNPEAKKEAENNKAACRAELERYLFYYHRFSNHDNSRKLEANTRKDAQEKMRLIQEQEGGGGEGGKGHNIIWGDVQFVEDATDQLLKCRLVLKWTYVLAWHLPEGSQQKELFCFLQQDLEQQTERLSGLLEKDPATLIGKEVKAEVLALAGVAAASRKKLLHGCEADVLAEIPAAPDAAATAAKVAATGGPAAAGSTGASGST